jgi:hypothetical protein
MKLDLVAFQIVLNSVAEPKPEPERKEPHHLFGAGSGSDGSGSDNGIKHGYEKEKDTKCNSL